MTSANILIQKPEVYRKDGEVIIIIIIIIEFSRKVGGHKKDHFARWKVP